MVEKCDKIDEVSIEIKTNCRDLPKISCLDRFLDLDQDFWDWKVVSRQNRDFSISIVETNFLKVSRFSRLSRPALCQCRDRESRSRQIETPKFSFKLKFILICILLSITTVINHHSLYHFYLSNENLIF